MNIEWKTIFFAAVLIGGGCGIAYFAGATGHLPKDPYAPPILYRAR